MRSILMLMTMLLLTSSLVADQPDVPKTKMVPIGNHAESVQSVISPDGDVVTFTSFQPFQPVRNFLRAVRGSIWHWANPAPYHHAAVMVRCPDGSAGSGTVVSVSGSVSLIVTCAHVVETSPTVSIAWQTGQRVRGDVVQRWDAYDLAAVAVAIEPSQLVSVPISPTSLPANARIEVMGFGGPRYGTFRPYVASLTPGESRICVDAPSIHGDSGAGMVSGGSLVGVQFGGVNADVQHAAGSTNAIPLIYPASSKADPGVLRQFVQTACRRIGGGCRPAYGQPRVQMQFGGGDNQFYPQQPIVQQPPPVQYQPQPVQANVSLDYNAIAQSVVEKLRNDPNLRGSKGDRGLAGPSGQDGRDGSPGDRGPTGQQGPAGQVTQAQLSSMVAVITRQLRNDPSLRGPQGERGEQGDAADLDLDAIAEAVIAKLPPISLALVGDDGNELDRDTVPLGGTLRLQLYTQPKLRKGN